MDTLCSLAKAGSREQLLVALFLYVGAQPCVGAKKIGLMQTLLSAAASAGRLTCVNVLLELGACPNTADADGIVPLHIASFMGYDKTVSFLLMAGADVNAKDRNKWTPLHYAAQGGNAKTVRALLRSGASPKSLDKQGQSPRAVALKLMR
jgi:ankyrin repeat protein